MISRLQSALSDYRYYSQQPNASYQDIVTLGSEVYGALLAPLVRDQNYTRLIIVPDGQLSLLPFEALVTEVPQDKSTGLMNLPYLIHHYEISYAHSLTLLAKKLRQPVQSANGKCLAFAPTYLSSATGTTAMRDNFRGIKNSKENLPGALAEVHAISQFSRENIMSGLKPRSIPLEQRHMNFLSFIWLCMEFWIRMNLAFHI